MAASSLKHAFKQRLTIVTSQVLSLPPLSRHCIGLFEGLTLEILLDSWLIFIFCSLTGEPDFVASSIRQYHDKAAKDGTGTNSLASHFPDLGVFILT